MEQNKKKPILLTTLIILLLATSLVLAIKDHTPDYQVSAKEMHIKLKDYNKNLISPQEFVEIYYSNDSLYRFIDLRNPREYANGHLPNSINLPLDDILNEEFIEILNQDSKINVLYHNDHSVACSPWMLLSQIGYKNNKLLMGGYDYVKSNIIDNFSPMSGEFRNEKAKYNYKEVINNASGGGTNTETATTTAPTVIPVKNNKKTESEGGC